MDEHLLAYVDSDHVAVPYTLTNTLRKSLTVMSATAVPNDFGTADERGCAAASGCSCASRYASSVGTRTCPFSCW